jgi:tetratricopeptide (TPR) repeat protein
MQFPKETPEPCSSCRNQVATEKYTCSGLTLMVCATCLDRLEVQDAFDHRFLHIVDLERNEQYDEALACLDAFLEANRHRDHDKWLARSIAMHRAMILFDAGRYAEAEQACEAWAELGFVDVGERWMHGSVTADTLDALGRSREGLAVLEEALSHRDPKHVPGACGHLARLADISERIGQPVDTKWRSLAEAVAKRFRVDMPVADSLGKAILELAEVTRGREPMRPHEWEKDEAEGDEP